MNNQPYFFCALLAIVGGAFSFYFYSVYKGWINHRQFWVPSFCELDSKQCVSIVDTKYGRLLGIPNAFVGIFLFLIYAIILISTALNYIDPIIPRFVGGFTIVLGLYLIYGLFRLKVACKICLLVHFLNAIIFFIQLI